jgi:hypothetical protein
MQEEKVTISWDDLKSQGVEDKLRQVEAVARAQEQYRSAPPPKQLIRHQRKLSLWYNTMVYMGVFGLLGSLLGWAGGALFHFRPNPQVQADQLMERLRDIDKNQKIGGLDAAKADDARREFARIGRNNAYFQVLQDPNLTAEEKQFRREELMIQDRWKQFFSNLLFYGVCGMMIAVGLGVAEPVMDRNYQRALIVASIAALIGLFGGLIVSLFVDHLYQWIAHSESLQHLGTKREILARAISWAVLGLFLSAAPGIALRNRKKLLIGLAGGLAGGLIGGLIFDPVMRLFEGEAISQLIAISAIGVIAGVATGWIENIAKSGWLKVDVGVIAGKQFVLYRNPTYIGSAPECQIFLFKDPRVGRRHAAVHIVPGGFEIEDLPLGGRTLVNGKAVSRSRLHTGDRVQVGSTTFVFQEKPRDP